MTKQISFLFLFFFTLTIIGQNEDRVRTMIEGQVIVPKGDDPEGLVVYNTVSERGTITDRNGVFYLSVAKNDEILVQSVQFNPITVQVDNGIVRTKKMSITLRESVNMLEEIVVTPYDLTGNIVADVNRVRTRPDTSFVDTANIIMEDGKYDRFSPVDNVALDDESWKYGINFVNIFKKLIGERKANPDQFETTAEDELTQMYDNAFFKQNLNINEDNIGAFLDYTANHGLDKEMLEPGNELNLIQFLIAQRDKYKEEQEKG